MHDLSRFTLVFYGFKKQYLNGLYPLTTIALMNTLTAIGFTLDQIRNYFDLQPNDLTFGYTKDRSLVARLNKAVETADIFLSEERYYEDSIEQTHASIFCNEFLVCQNNY